MNEVMKQVEELQREKQARETGSVDVEVQGIESPAETENQEVELKEEKPKGDIEVQEEQEVSSETKEEVVEKKEDTPNDKEKYSKAVQKRMDEYAYKLGEARRREEEAIQIAKAIKEERDKIKAQLAQTNEGYFTEFGGRLTNSMEAAKSKLKKAMEDQDHEAMAQAQLEIGRLGAEQARYDTMKQEREQLAKNPVQEEDVKIPEAQQQPIRDPKAESWAANNEWFGNDKVMTTVAYAIHDELVNEGIDPRSDIYYSEIDKRMRDNLPHKFNGQTPPVEEEAPAPQQPVQTVASANRNRGTGRNVVKLSSTELHMAKRLNLTPEQYAKEKLKLQNNRR